MSTLTHPQQIAQIIDIPIQVAEEIYLQCDGDFEKTLKVATEIFKPEKVVSRLLKSPPRISQPPPSPDTITTLLDTSNSQTYIDLDSESDEESESKIGPDDSSEDSDDDLQMIPLSTSQQLQHSPQRIHRRLRPTAQRRRSNPAILAQRNNQNSQYDHDLMVSQLTATRETTDMLFHGPESLPNEQSIKSYRQQIHGSPSNSNPYNNQKLSTSAADAFSSDISASPDIPSFAITDDSELYLPPTHLNYSGSFDKFKALAQRAMRWLVINIQDPDSFESHKLNRDTWSSTKLGKILTEDACLWQVHKNSQLFNRFHQFYPTFKFPRIAIIDPETMECVWSHTGFVSASEILNQFSLFSRLDSDFRWYLAKKNLSGEFADSSTFESSSLSSFRKKRERDGSIMRKSPSSPSPSSSNQNSQSSFSSNGSLSAFSTPRKVDPLIKSATTRLALVLPNGNTLKCIIYIKQCTILNLLALVVSLLESDSFNEKEIQWDTLIDFRRLYLKYESISIKAPGHQPFVFHPKQEIPISFTQTVQQLNILNTKLRIVVKMIPNNEKEQEIQQSDTHG